MSCGFIHGKKFIKRAVTGAIILSMMPMAYAADSDDKWMSGEYHNHTG